jgi:phenylacetate-coenzyme A ligase PaaK-like adenylate-forming protein
MRRWLYQILFRLLGISRLYRQIVVEDRFTGIRGRIRGDLTRLLTFVNENNPFFEGRFTEFLKDNRDVDDETFLANYARLPALSKEDYARAGQQVMSQPWPTVDPGQVELQVAGRPVASLRRLRQGNFLMPMATGGSSALPLVVYMTRHHMFSMLFTFFKCWYRMGWRPGQRMLIFYPRNTYNIDDMMKFNRFSRITGFRYHLFDHIDEPTVRGLVDDLNRYRPHLLLVFPSPLNMIAHTIRRHRLPLQHQPPLINVSGETFFDCQRRNIADVFPESRIEDSYGSVELGEIAHETDGGLEIFAQAAYVETEPNEAGQPEMIVTSLLTRDFPFIRYKMRDIADVVFDVDAEGRQRYLIRRIEGKDSNYILSARGQRFYPSFFNRLVNHLNRQVDDAIIEIKVRERNQAEMEICFIVRDPHQQESIHELTTQYLRQELDADMDYVVRFVDFIDHDYRRKYRVIERMGDVEFAGGMVGDERKAATIEQVETETLSSQRERPGMTSRANV